MYKNRRHPTEVECRLFCCPILLGRCRFCNFLKLLSYRHTAYRDTFLLHFHSVPSRSRRDSIAPEVRPKCAQSSFRFIPPSNKRHSSSSSSSVQGFPLFSGSVFSACGIVPLRHSAVPARSLLCYTHGPSAAPPPSRGQCHQPKPSVIFCPLHIHDISPLFYF